MSNAQVLQWFSLGCGAGAVSWGIGFLYQMVRQASDAATQV